ncbi:MAG: hypothetical protein JSS57_22190 [Proteobacteria bacterium]|nr:hypothetical protein [Pseudomonadota bacterium]RTL42977.1 MAG: hypothetical protein EKK49_00595 [Rhodocyclaceae bacterium]
MQAPEKITALQISSQVSRIDAGMYIFRYSLDAQSTSKVCISLSPTPLGDGVIDFFPSEGVRDNTLASPSDCIVARVKGGPANILVTTFRSEDDTSNVHLRMDRISTAPSPAPARPTATSQTQLELLGHIETQGDVISHNTWLGDPTTRLRLEGFSINWPNAPGGMTLAYSCRTGADGERYMGVPGQFIGSRGKGKPITLVTFALTGPRSADFELSGKAVFAGEAPLAIASGKVLSGPTGTEHLVALQLEITPKSVAASPWNDHPNLQVFRNP